MLKIDKSFVDHLVEDGESGGAAVINGLMRIAEKLGVEVVAEGVETEWQRDRLMTLGCKCGQGYLFSPAIPNEHVDEMLVQSAARQSGEPTSLTAQRVNRRVRPPLGQTAPPNRTRSA